MEKEKLLKIVELSEKEVYDVDGGGWSWQGAIAGCGGSVVGVVQQYGTTLNMLPPHLRAGGLGVACAWGGYWGGQTP